jgi:hypothetical protein
MLRRRVTLAALLLAGSMAIACAMPTTAPILNAACHHGGMSNGSDTRC